MRFIVNWSTVFSVALVLSNNITGVVATDDDTSFVQLGQDLDGEAASDYSGASVALSNDGKSVAVGAVFNDGNGDKSGHARVYKFNDGSALWEQMGQDLDGEDSFNWAGMNVDLSADGTVVAVGATMNSDVAFFGGHVRVFQYNGNLWEQIGDDIDGDKLTGTFGISLSLSEDGKVLAASATTYIRVHKYDTATGWSMLGQEIERSHGGCTKQTSSLSPDGRVLAVGEQQSGQVRVLKYEDSSELWIPMGPTINEAFDGFGCSVSLSHNGTFLAAGAPWGTGSASVFEYDGETWNAFGTPFYGNEGFGNAMEISSNGQRIVTGDSKHDDDLNVDVGSVGLCEYDGIDTWFQVGPDLVGEAEEDQSGSAVALSGDGRILASGAPFNDGNGEDSGHIRVYESQVPPPPGSPPANPPAKGTPPGGSGDPHFKTWTGESYDFHGLCDLVLLQNHGFKNGLGLDIHIRTKKMKQWSFISNAVLRIGEDSLEIMGDTNGEIINYWINGIKGKNGRELTNNALLDYSISGHPIFYRRTSAKQHEFTVNLGGSDDEKIVMKTWKELIPVDMYGATEMDFGESLGLMGTFHTGLHMGRDGTTEFTDINDFGKEWQVLPSEPMLFHSLEGPQAPEKCVLPTSTKLRRRLSENIISQEQAAIACASILDEADRDMCIFDVMATNDVDIIGAY